MVWDTQMREYGFFIAVITGTILILLGIAFYVMGNESINDGWRTLTVFVLGVTVFGLIVIDLAYAHALVTHDIT
jgi:hypothetical protein